MTYGFAVRKITWFISCQSDNQVPFIIASEASYVYILSEQKFIKNAKTILKKEGSGQTVLPEWHSRIRNLRLTFVFLD